MAQKARVPEFMAGNRCPSACTVLRNLDLGKRQVICTRPIITIACFEGTFTIVEPVDI